jgi:hypothetical protein
MIARAVAEGRYMPWTPREGVWSELATLSVTTAPAEGGRCPLAESHSGVD